MKQKNYMGNEGKQRRIRMSNRERSIVRKRRQKRNILISEVILGIIIILTGGHIISRLSGHTAFSKSYYYNNDSNITMGDVMTVKAQTPRVLLVNKENALPADYVPENLVMPDVAFAANTSDERRKMEPEAAEALEELFAAGQQDGVQLVGVSAFRSYNTQSGLYYRSINRNGYDYASIYSAQPGKSEHQTGMAIDVSCSELGYQLYSRFAQTKEGIWLADHCEEYGFIIRYPDGKTDITGYAYEPWHIRYVGVQVAQYLKTHGITLDEYQGAIPYERYFGFEDNSPTTENPAAAATEAATESTTGEPSTQATEAWNTTQEKEQAATTENQKNSKEDEPKRKSSRVSQEAAAKKDTNNQPKATTSKPPTTEVLQGTESAVPDVNAPEEPLVE